MNLITTAGSWGLVLDTEGGRRRGDGQTESHHLAPHDEGAECTGHFILNRYRVDDDGFICFSPSLPLSDLRSSIDILKAELEGLLVQAEQRFPHAVLKRQLVAST